MKKTRILYSVLVFLLAICIVSVSYGYEILPCADAVFSSATPSLLSSKSVTFTAFTTTPKANIHVSACWLEMKINGSWDKVCDLTAPSASVSNVMVFSTTKSYASQIGTGTFRVWATFIADGHEVTRCSNERTF